MPTIDERIHPRGKVTYRVRVRMRGIPAQVKTFRTKTAAKAWGQSVEAAIREGKNFPYTQSRKRTLNEMIEKYIREILPTKPKSLEKQTMQLNWWKSQIGDCLLSEVTPSLIAKQRDILLSGITVRKKKRSPATVNRYLAVLSHAFTIADKEWQWVRENPVAHITHPKESRGRDRYLTEDEITRLLGVCKLSRNKSLYTIVKLGICTGLRRSEILGLRSCDILWKEKRIIIPTTKNSEMHSLPMSDVVFNLLKDHMSTHLNGSEYIFPAKDNRKPADISSAWDMAVTRAQIENCTMHDLRRTCATFLASNGSSTLEIGKILNHKTLAMVRRYSFHSDDSLSLALNNMNSKLFGDTHDQ